jgi:hypothetical protein
MCKMPRPPERMSVGNCIRSNTFTPDQLRLRKNCQGTIYPLTPVAAHQWTYQILQGPGIGSILRQLTPLRPAGFLRKASAPCQRPSFSPLPHPVENPSCHTMSGPVGTWRTDFIQGTQDFHKAVVDRKNLLIGERLPALQDPQDCCLSMLLRAMSVLPDQDVVQWRCSLVQEQMALTVPLPMLTQGRVADTPQLQGSGSIL